MASVYRRSYVDKSGRKRQCEAYTVEVKVGDRIEQLPAFRHQKASGRVA